MDWLRKKEKSVRENFLLLFFSFAIDTALIDRMMGSEMEGILPFFPRPLCWKQRGRKENKKKGLTEKKEEKKNGGKEKAFMLCFMVG